MGVFSSSVSITQYHVEGKIQEPVLDTVYKGLKKNIIVEIDQASSDKATGWTCISDPFNADFDQFPFLIGTQFVFSLRIDKKSIPSKVIHKHTALEIDKKRKISGREFLSKSEKKEITEHVLHKLHLRIPATPYIYDIIWNYENNDLWFFSNLKGANEALETLFARSFQLKLIRLFPYTMAVLRSPLATSDKDLLTQFTQTRFKE
jgi:hypothetical protein